MKNNTNTLRKNLLLFFVSLSLSIIFSEIALRVVLPPPIVWESPQDNYIYDSEIGHWLEPNQSTFTHDKPVITNSIGIRDIEYPSTAPPDVNRILALGDSQTFGNGLDLKDTWPKQLESILNQSRTGMRFEVINSGLPGSNTWQHEIMLERMISNYHPHSVVLAFYVNDVSNRTTPKPSHHKTDSDLSNRIAYALKQSVFLLTLRKVYYSIQHSFSPTKRNLRQLALLNGEYNPVIEKAWEQVETSLSAMKKITDKHNMSFVIVSLPRQDQIDGRLPWNAYNKNLQAITEKYKISMISVFEPLQQGYKKYGEDLFIPWDGHNSKAANQIIAQNISNSFGTNIDNTIAK